MTSTGVPPTTDASGPLSERGRGPAQESQRKESLRTAPSDTPAVGTFPRRSVPRWAQILIWAILLALLIFLGLGLKRSQQGTVQPGDKIPDFKMALYSGYEYNGQAEVQLSALRGKVVLINFWASWCKPCEQEAASLEGAWSYYAPGGNVAFLGVDYVDTEPAARKFMKKFGNTYANGADVGTRVSQMFRIKGVPETYILDTTGVLKYIKVGPFASVDEIRTLIDPLLP